MSARPQDMRRHFVTPEGVDLRLELAGASERAVALSIDAAFMLGTLILLTIAIGMLMTVGKSEVLLIIWLIGFFVLRNGWFILFEMGGRGATPGKRLLGLRVVARDGARLTGGAVVARNAMREIELFLPLSFLGYQTAQGTADGLLFAFALLWSGIFLLFPFFNHDRLRVGDLIAGTWVIRTVRQKLVSDLGAVPAERPQRRFSDAALDLYGIYELHTLESVLRAGHPPQIATVAAAIRRKAGLPDDGDDQGFLADYYAALCARLERGVLLGRRRDDKFGGRSRSA